MDDNRRTYTDWRGIIAIVGVCLGIVLLVLLVVLLTVANQQEPFMMAVVVVIAAVMGAGFALALHRIHTQHADRLLQVIQAPRMSAAPTPSNVQVIDAQPTRRALLAAEFRPQIKDFDTDGQRMELDVDLIRKFFDRCYPVCSREAWRADNNDYAKLTRFFSRRQNPPLLQQGTGFRWADWVTADVLRDWVSASLEGTR